MIITREIMQVLNWFLCTLFKNQIKKNNQYKINTENAFFEKLKILYPLTNCDGFIIIFNA